MMLFHFRILTGVIMQRLEEIGADQWLVPHGNRSLRCTGVALSVAVGLLGACLPGTSGHIVALVGGSCTIGHGSEEKGYNKIVSQDLSDPVRSHKDLDKDAALYFRKTLQFYEELAKQMVGVAEMKVLIKRTGGLVVLSESFGHPVFKDSFKRVFRTGEEYLGLSYNGILEINCSKDIKIKKGPAVASTAIGQENTTAWKLCGLDEDTCLTVLFDISSSDKPDHSENMNPQLFIQTITRVLTKSGLYQKSFDQETAAVVMARLTSYKMETEVFNNSPDETAYFRMMLNRESITNTTVMIQPSLISYSLNSLLDVASISADRILMLDLYFSVVIFHGLTIAQWRNMGYQDQPEHQAFAQLLQAPHEDAELIMRDRFPIPRLVVCDQHGSQALFLLAKLNPSSSYNNEVGSGMDVIFTDDVSLQVFFEHLQRLAVQSS
ncbi:hypothetical protein L1987_37537 [Smallanthus sonchifolius]|uniref:Uncharacterized protein n=1 Tax=Smallanthus sonchifolius TaxID=185202 RepID=A0ACB9HHV9_9ASTR|nr:hypothetical protein L1987_37537 [Smallanthus sonchifolius]